MVLDHPSLFVLGRFLTCHLAAFASNALTVSYTQTHHFSQTASLSPQNPLLLDIHLCYLLPPFRFRLTVPSAISFLGVFLRRAGALGYLRTDGPSSERVREEAQQILLCVLRDASSLEHPPSALAAAALYWASCISAPGAAPPTSFAFLAVTGYELEQLCRCLRDMESVRTGGGGGGGGGLRSRSSSPSFSSPGTGGGGGGGDSLFGGAAFPEHAGQSLFGAGGGHPAIAAL